MDVMSSAISGDLLMEKARSLGALIREHQGREVLVLDLRELNSWTDFFIIATVTSGAHVQGLQRHIKEFTAREGIEILHHRRKAPADDLWNLVDLGSIVIHLMSAQARDFYELERLWNAGIVLDLPQGSAD